MSESEENLKSFYSNSPDMLTPRAKTSEPEARPATEIMADAQKWHPEVSIDRSFYNKTNFPEQTEFLDLGITKGEVIPRTINIEAVPAHVITRLRDAHAGIGQDLVTASAHYLGTLFGLEIVDKHTEKTLRQLHSEITGFADRDAEPLAKIIDILKHLRPMPAQN
jgi:hypothetical protein